MSDEARGLTVRAKLPPKRERGRRQRCGAEPDPPVEPKPTPVVEEVPRTARLLALAIVFEDMVRTGEVDSYAAIARRAGVSRAQISKVMTLLQLPPATQRTSLLTSRRGRKLPSSLSRPML